MKTVGSIDSNRKSLTMRSSMSALQEVRRQVAGSENDRGQAREAVAALSAVNPWLPFKIGPTN